MWENEYLAEFREMIINDYGMTIKSITSRNPQATAILEWVHQAIGNIPRTFKVQKMVLDEKNSMNGILVSTMFALRATVHTTTQYTSSKLIYGLDSIINWRHGVDWESIRKQKQDVINKGNISENRNQINNTYKQRDKVLLQYAWKKKFN